MDKRSKSCGSTPLKEKITAILAIIVMVSFIGICFLALTGFASARDDKLMALVIGGLGALVAGVLKKYFGIKNDK